MTDIVERNYRCDGYRRIHACLSDRSVNISEEVVRRLMKQVCLVAATNKRRRCGSYMGEINPAPDNLLNGDFSACSPNEKWLTDITEFQIAAGKVHLSPMVDCFDGMVVSLSIGTRPNAELVNKMLDAAIDKVAVSGSLGFRSPAEHRRFLERCLTSSSFWPHPQWVSFKSALTPRTRFPDSTE